MMPATSSMLTCACLGDRRTFVKNEGNKTWPYLQDVLRRETEDGARAAARAARADRLTARAMRRAGPARYCLPRHMMPF